jgi:membrane fusion protein (multidrug efflux system)
MNAVTDKPEASGDTQRSLPTPKRRARPPVLRIAAVLLVLLVAAVTLNWWLVEGRYIESTDNAYVQGDIVVLASRIEGDISAINAADNRPVHAGDPLISLDRADWQARVAQARGNVGEIVAGSDTARRQVEQARVAIAQAEAQIAQAQAELVRATAEAKRSGALAGAGWTSRQADEQATSDARKAEAMLDAARAQRANADRALSVADAQVAQSDSRRLAAEAAVQLAENNLSYTVIRAPFDGIVGNRAVQVGQHVLPGQQLLSLTPVTRDLYVVANFKETQLRRMRPGQKVVLTPDIDGDAAVTGHVDSLAPATGALFSLLPPENATGNFTKVVQRVPVKIVLDPSPGVDAWLRAGLSVTAEVDTRGPDAQHLGLFGAAAASLRMH